MKRWILISCPLVMMFILSGYGFKTLKVSVPDQLKMKEPTLVSFPQDETSLPGYKIRPPYIGSQFIGFKEALAFKESQGNYFVTNTYGYLGKYQFGLGTLALVGIYDGNHFLRNPELQERAFYVNISRNKWILRKDIKRFVGMKMRGIEITESGILAAAHLAGPGNVKIFLRSQGRMDIKDGYGTSISNYMKKFSGYDISIVSPKRNPRI
ncbi:hypothetical protein Q2T41_01190 [Maribacter confluentis]|uniref:Peptidoglycan-binding protein LysM n=1 Tax=Maribacter confluentis TaxID=1656093 RepID=A0ABT8RLD3_9FLAO|nr:hypothetical protein [Maribacter confluentis]MDO1511277.1 hypothetical protein [Maribacter confluentis]